MAVTQTLLTSGGTQTDASSYDSASISPTANSLVLVAVFSNAVASAEPTVTGASMTWVKLTTDGTNLDASGTRRVTVFRGLSATPGTGALTMDYGGQTQLRSAWIISEFAGVDTSGTNGSGAIVQSVKGNDVGAPDSTSLTINLAAFGSATNATWGVVEVAGGATTVTNGSGFTEIVEVTDPAVMQSQFKASSDTTVDWTYDASSEGWGIAAEIKEAAAAAAANHWLLMGV